MHTSTPFDDQFNGVSHPSVISDYPRRVAATTGKETNGAQLPPTHLTLWELESVTIQYKPMSRVGYL